jgi:hypothetical protein
MNRATPAEANRAQLTVGPHLSRIRPCISDLDCPDRRPLRSRCPQEEGEFPPCRRDEEWSQSAHADTPDPLIRQGKTMKALTISIMLLLSASAMAHDRVIHVRSSNRAFERCLVAAWIRDYCRSTYWTNESYAVCAARVDRDIYLHAHHYWYSSVDYCWAPFSSGYGY